MIAIVTVILALLKAVGLIQLSWGIVLTPLFIEIIYWFLEYIEYDSKMVDLITAKNKGIESMNDLEFNEMFITGGSTVNPTVYVTAEQFVRDIMGDEEVDEFLRSKNNNKDNDVATDVAKVKEASAEE